MREELIRWFSDSLGLPFVEEREDGSVYYNDAAQKTLNSERKMSFAQSVNRLVGNNIDLSTLEDKITHVRSGTPVECIANNGQKVLFAPVGGNRACAVIVTISFDRQTLRWGSDRNDLMDGLSHELANALGAIAGWAQLARSGTRVEEALELIEKASNSAWSISRQILGHHDEKFSEDASSVTDVSAFVNEAVRLIALKASQVGVAIRQSVAPGLEVKGTRDDVWSMIWNLMTNAVEAMPYGGTLAVEVTSQDEFIRIVVEDNGPGIEDKIKERIFQPYFSTKKRGTGLGLALVKQSVDALGGAIDVETHKGEGTRFIIELPRIDESNRGKQQANRTNGRVSGVYLAEPINGRILLVEDDLGLREMMATALAIRGARVIAVSNASESLATEGQFDIALIDMQLPDITGDQLLANLREARKVSLGIIVTGRNRPPSYAQGGEPDGFLRKPFQIEELFERVATVLGLEKRGEAAVS
jgi:signal transduction histidine kinase/CheY-like chemotaxis protein